MHPVVGVALAYLVGSIPFGVITTGADGCIEDVWSWMMRPAGVFLRSSGNARRCTSLFTERNM